MTSTQQQGYHVLLQPLKSLAENWDIDIASELTEYVEDLERIRFSIPGRDGTMNFAEAAMMIQGSAMVYAKKVEFLHALVFQTLNLLTTGKKKLFTSENVDLGAGNLKDSKSAKEKGEKESLALHYAELPFLPLDDLPQADNIDLDEDLTVEVPRKASQRHDLGAQASAFTTNTGNPGSTDNFRLTSCAVHPSGALLLDANNVDGFMTSSLDAPAEFAAPDMAINVSDDNIGLDDDFGGGGGGGGGDIFDDSNEIAIPHGSASSSSSQQQQQQQQQSATTTTFAQQKGGPTTMGRKVITASGPVSAGVKDPWALLDPHDGSAIKLKPFRKGRTVALPRISVAEVKAPAMRRTPPVINAPSLFKQTSFSDLGYAMQGELQRRGQYRPSLWQEFEVDGDQLVPGEMGEIDLDGFGGALGPHTFDARTVQPESYDALDSLIGGDNDDDFGGGGGGGGAIDFDDLPNPLGVDGMHLPSSYSDLCKSQLDAFMAQRLDPMQKGLAERVLQWEESIASVMKQVDSRPEFELEQYANNVMQTVTTEGKKPTPTAKPQLHFSDVVGNKEEYDISRTFLVVLELANRENLEIVKENGEDFLIRAAKAIRH